MDVWEEASLAHRLKIERTLNFTTMPHEEDEYSYSQKKISRDPMSHRIIEKRRRDRMNNCLADLSRLIPPTYLKKGRGRIEKTEIIEMATKHLRHLQAHACKDPATCEVSLQQQQRDDFSARRAEDNRRQDEAMLQRQREQHRLGFQECSSETVRFLVESEGFDPTQGICLRLLQHLQAHYEKLVQGVCYMGGDSHGSERRESDAAPINGQAPMLHHQEDSNMFHLDSSSNHSLCESYPIRQTNIGSHTSVVGVINRSLKRSSSQISDCPSNSVEVLRLGHQPTERIGSMSVRTVEEMEEDNSRHVNFSGGSTSVIERPISLTSPHLLALPGPSHTRSHLRDILNQDSCPASYEQKRLRSNSIESTRSCQTTTGVVSSHGYQTSDVFANRSAEEVYKFKNNIKERFRADVLHHSFDIPNGAVGQHGISHHTHEPMRAPVHSISSEVYNTGSKLSTSESFGISRMFPSTGNHDGRPNSRNERSFATLNGFGSFTVNNGELGVKIPADNNNAGTEPVRRETVVEHPSSRSSSCGSNPSPSSLSSNCFNQNGRETSNHNSSNNSGAEGGSVNKTTASSSGHSSTSGYSTSGEGSSTISVCKKNNRNSSCSSGSPLSSGNNTGGETSPSCGLLKMEEQTSSNEGRQEIPVSLVPVFALHPKGSFYIPMTLESTTLAPHLRDRDFMMETEDRLPLHPINISVCFHPGSMTKDRGQPMDNWRSKRDRENTYEHRQFRPERVY